MKKLDNELENRKIIIEKLIDYGFINNDNYYLFNHKLSIGNLNVVVEVKNDKMTSRIIDINTNEDYILVDISGSSGEFVGKVKEEYENIILDIIEKCTIIDVFKSKQAKQVIKYIKEKYNDNLEYLWKKFPKNAVWRNKKNNSWYGALLVVQENKLGINSDKTIEILDIRCSNVNKLIDNKNYYPGYHMNKDNWITIKLDNTLEINTIYKLIDDSYDISLRK